MLPQTDRLYRCPVCRLELTFDPHLKKLRPVSVPPNGTGEKTRNIA
jgi:hypothetical protein